MKKWNLGRILLLTAAIIAIAGSVAYYLLDGNDKTFTWLGVALALAGAVSTVLCYSRFRLAPFVSVALYAVSFGLVLRVAVPSLSDVWNKVNFIGGNAAMGMTFSCVYLFCAILAVCACFTGTEKLETI